MYRSLAVFALSAVSLLAQSPRYTIHDLGALNNGAVTGINARGQVIGYETQSDGHVRSFRTAPNAAINWTTDDLGSLGGTTTRARGINASGQVVGESTLTTGESRAFRTAANKSIQPSTDNLRTLGGSMSKGFAINDSGQVTGTSTVDSNVNYAFVTAPNSPINPAADRIDARRGINTGDANGLFVNNRGHVLGTVADYPTAFLRTERSTTILPFIQYIWQDFAGLTEQDQAVYTSATGLALWQNGKITELIACPSPCVPTGVNSSLHVVGATMKNSFLYRDGVLYDLSTLLPAGSGWAMPDTSGGPSPLRINDLGQIAGIATLNNEVHAFRLDPVLSVTNAIEKALNMLSSMAPNFGRRNSGLLMMKSTLTSRLNDALASWDRGNSAATRGLLNEFESLVRAQAGQVLTADQANQLIAIAEAAFGLT